MNAPQDYDDTEGDVLERVSRVRQWIDIIRSVWKTIAFLVGFGAVSVAGNINGENYWKEAAIEVGILDGPVAPDIVELIAEPVVEYSLAGHKHNYPDPVVVRGPAGKNGKDGKDGEQGKNGEQGIQGLKGDIGLPGANGTNAITEQAIDAHISDDH